MGAKEVGGQLLERLLGHVVRSVPGAVGAGLSIIEGEQVHSVSGVGVAADLDQLQWSVRQGPLWDAVRSGTTVVLPPEPATQLDLTAWPQLAEGAPEKAGQVHGLVAVLPDIAVVTDEDKPREQLPVVSVYVDGPPPGDSLEGLQRLAGVLAEALTVVELGAGEEARAEQMLQMMQYRRVIEQAKGLIMGAVGADAGAAFTTLARASQHFNVRLRNLAVALVEHVGGAPAEGPDDPAQVITPSANDRRVAAQVWAALTAPARSGGFDAPRGRRAGAASGSSAAGSVAQEPAAGTGTAPPAEDRRGEAVERDSGLTDVVEPDSGLTDVVEPDSGRADAGTVRIGETEASAGEASVPG